MLVFVTSDATGRQAEPGTIEVLRREQCPRRRRNVLRIVAGATADVQVLAVEHVARFRVIKTSWRRIPMQQGEVPAVMIRMAFDASRSRWPRARKSGVKTLVALQLVPNLAVTVDAAKGGRLGGDLMTLDAILRSVQALMGTGERSWRNLCTGGHAAQGADKQEKADREPPRPLPRGQSPLVCRLRAFLARCICLERN